MTEPTDREAVFTAPPDPGRRSGLGKLSPRTWRRVRYAGDFIWFWAFTIVFAAWAAAAFRAGGDRSFGVYAAAALITANHADHAYRKMIGETVLTFSDSTITITTGDKVTKR